MPNDSATMIANNMDTASGIWTGINRAPKKIAAVSAATRTSLASV